MSLWLELTRRTALRLPCSPTEDVSSLISKIDLRKPSQSRPSKFELEYLAVLPDFDGFPTDSNREQSPEIRGTPSTGDTYFDLEQDARHLKPCDGECPADPLEAWIMRPFIRHRIFEGFAPASSHLLLSNLRERLYPPTLSFTLRVINGDLEPKRIPNSQEMIDFLARPADISTSLYWSECPRVKPEDILMAQMSHPQNQNLVIFQGKKCWFKAVHDTIPEKVFAREIDTLLRVKKMTSSNQTRVPRLNGLVIVGFVYG